MLGLVNCEALQEIEERMSKFQKEEKRVKEQIEISTVRFQMKEELAQAKARIEVYTRYESEENALRVIDAVYCNGGHDLIQGFESQLDPVTKIEIEPVTTAVPSEPLPSSSMTRGTTELHPCLNPYTSNFTPTAANDPSAVDTISDPRNLFPRKKLALMQHPKTTITADNTDFKLNFSRSPSYSRHKAGTNNKTDN
jgi:hypothetical protein